jgi:PAS domain S-box-containing protein
VAILPNTETGAREQELEALLALATRAGGVAVSLQDRALRYKRALDPASSEQAEALLRRRDDEVDDPRTAERLLSAKRRVLESGRGERLVTPATNGSKGTREILLEPLRDPSGEVVGVLSARGSPIATSEASEWSPQVDRRAGTSLGHQFHELLEQTSAYIYVKDLEGRYTLASQQIQTLFGDEVIGRTDFDLVPLEYAEQWRANDRRAIETLAPVEVEETDGRVTLLSVKVPLLDGSGLPYAVCGFSSDITTYKRMTERVFSTQRLESLGQLAGGVAHDFNNLLSVIGTFSSYLLDDVEEGRARSDLQAIQGAVRRGAELTRQLLLFSGRRPADEPESVSVTESLENVERLLRPTIGKQIDIDFRLEAPSAFVAGHGGHLEQIVMNLALNARDAMPEGGRMAVAADVPSAAELGADAPGLDLDRSYIRLSVEDSGSGMSPAEAARAMEPFFTTKAKGEGTGLGLASVYGIARQLEGTVVIDSAEGRGTTVRVYLPAETGERAVSEGGGMGLRRPSAEITPVVLLVEDDADVREGTARILSRAGYAVIPVADGEEGLSVLAASEAEVDVALIEVVLPGMSGLELARRIREEAPQVSIVHMSGSARSIGAEPVVEKPFPPDRLVAEIHRAMSGGGIVPS